MRRKSGNARIDNFQGVVIGSDEAGYGCWAGCLVVCAASAPQGWDDERFRDSKDYDNEEALREQLRDEVVKSDRFPHHVVLVKPEDIDRNGVYMTLQLAHQEALKAVYAKVGGEVLAIVDGNLPVYKMGLDFPVVALPKADVLIPECSLASVIAKTTQCRLMVELDQKYPGYGFANHMGYGTPEHEAAIKTLGVTDVHRKTYRPIREALEREESQGQIQEAWTLLDED